MEKALGPKYWLVLRPGKTARQADIIGRLSEWLRHEYRSGPSIARAIDRKLTVESEGRRRISVLTPTDAHIMFLDLLERETIVLSEGDIYVLLNPMKDPPRKLDCVSLADFVGEKGRFVTVTDEGSDIVDLAKSALQTAIDVDPVADVNDPRILPMHVFLNSRPFPQLTSSEQREKFRQRYRKSGRVWVDGNDNAWELPHPNQWHASPQSNDADVRICSFLVPHGLHWDVGNTRAASTLATTSEVWRIDRGGYVNVYPNEKVRGFASSRKIWPSKRKI